MSSNDDALIEKAATTIYACQHYDPEDFAHETARAVLDAIGDDLRAEGWTACVTEAEDCGWMHDFAADDMAGRNPYWQERT